MPHYKDGTPAYVGDLVKGTGYNVKGADGKPAVLVGRLLDVTSGASSCNIKLAHVLVEPILPSQAHNVAPGQLHAHNDGSLSKVRYDLEYGQADHFELLHRDEVKPSAPQGDATPES